MHRSVSATLVWVLIATSIAALGAQSNQHDDAVAKVRSSAAFKQAVAVLDRDFDRMVAELITLTEIPAPPFKESVRAKAYLEMLRASGLTDVEQDEEGNVMGLRRGTGGGPLIAVAAHLDTVFPEGTDV